MFEFISKRALFNVVCDESLPRVDSANCDALKGGAGGVLCRIPFLAGTAGNLRMACVFIGVIDLLLSESIEPLLDIFLLNRL